MSPLRDAEVLQACTLLQYPDIAVHYMCDSAYRSPLSVETWHLFGKTFRVIFPMN